MTTRIYLDNAATSWPKPEGVILAMADFLREQGCSPGRGGYDCALQAGREVLRTRELLADFLGSSSPENVIFTYNATYALNFALQGLLKPGDHVITSDLEHNAVWRPLKTLEKNRGISISIFPFSQVPFREQEFNQLIKPRTRLIIINHSSNITGQILPVREIGSFLQKKEDILFVVDSAQTAGCVPLDLEEMGIDIIAYTGHKGLLGPPGTGGLLMSNRAAAAVNPLIQGGTGSSSDQEFQPDFLPDKMESGTLNMPGIVGLKAGIQYIKEKGLPALEEKRQNLVGFLRQGLMAIPEIQLLGSADNNTDSVSITCREQDPAFLAHELGRRGVMARGGLHCCPQGHQALNTFPQGSLRFSPGIFNTREEIEITLEILQRILKENN